MTPTTLLILYCAVVVAASLVGGFAPSLVTLSHRSLQFVLSFIAGIMLGVGFFHMLPHALMLQAESGKAVDHNLVDPIMLWAVLGFLTLFLLERFSHFHQHEPVLDDAEHDHADRAHGHPHAQRAAGQGGRVGWLGALAGLGIHSLLEGVALAASVAVGAAHADAAGAVLAGLGTFLVIALHKPFDAMTLATLMRRAGAPLRVRVLANILLAALVPAGVGLFWAGATGSDVEPMAAIALAFSAGMFVCIASSDLLPELQFHRHDRVGLSLALVIGLGFAYGLGRLEASTHVHIDGSHPHVHDHAH
ncbi:MAG: ZIP family metal transporter [Phycisphaerae bacterium]|nr:ZIP family metal transporter [Phycisphaerae bacterium]